MPSLFPSLIQEALFWAVLVGGLVVFATAIARRQRRYDRSAKKTIAETPESTKLRPLAIVALLAVIGLAIWFGYGRIEVLPNWLFFPGLTVYVPGLAFSAWAFSTLGRFYAGALRVQVDQKVIDTRPFALVRHPAYAGGMLAVLGIVLALQSWAAVLLLVAPLGFLVSGRIRIEERFLAADLGDEYRQYMKRTKRLIPFIW